MNDNLVDFQIHGVTGYTVMSNYHLQDKNLSIRAKGLLSLMLSLPKDWDYSINGLVTLSKDGRDMIKSTLNELKQAQYVSIDEYREANGHFKYKYSVYYLPYPKWLEMSKLTEDGFTTSVRPYTVGPEPVKPKEQNNNNKKDKLDKTLEESSENIKHSFFTKQLIKRNYISEDDSSSFLFDQLFEDLLKQGNDFKDLLIMTNYVVSKTKERNFKDEEGNEIKNKYGYFKNALIGNIKRFENLEHLYEDDSEYDWLNDNEEDYEL